MCKSEIKENKWGLREVVLVKYIKDTNPSKWIKEGLSYNINYNFLVASLPCWRAVIVNEENHVRICSVNNCRRLAYSAKSSLISESNAMLQYTVIQCFVTVYGLVAGASATGADQGSTNFDPFFLQQKYSCSPY